MQSSTPVIPALQYEQLTVAYTGGSNRTIALENFSASVGSGEVLALVGESGSGKSTAGFAVGGLLPAENTEISGRICLNGEWIEARNFAAFRKFCGRTVGFVFQEPSSALHPSMSIATQVGESIHGSISRSDRRERVAELLQSVHLEPDRRLLRAYPHHLSGGMQQRVVLAIAMANRPSILIADEPTTALDPTIRREILEMIRAHALSSNYAALLITHDFGIVSHFADRVAVLYHGKLVESGETAKILDAPQHEYTRKLLASARGTHRDS